MALVSMGMLPMESINRPKRRRSAEDDESEIEDSDDQQYSSPGPQNDILVGAATVSSASANTSPRTNPPASASPSLSPPTTNVNVATPASSDLPLDGFAFDTQDLAGSFSQLNGVEKGQGVTWSEQLEQLQTLYGSGYGEPNSVHPAGQPDVGVGISASSGAFFGPPAGVPSASTTSWPSTQPLSTGLEQNDDSLLSTQDVALWTGVPSGYE